MSENKTKLASAGSSGVCSLVGLAAAGPIGLIAGSYIGSKTAQTVLNDETSEEQTEMKSQPERTRDPTQKTIYPGDHLQQQYQHKQQHSTLIGQQVSTYPKSSTAQSRTPDQQERYSQKQISAIENRNMVPSNNYSTRRQQQQQNQRVDNGYKFGDFTRSIISKGKQADSRSTESGYKFGDFTRGLFK